MRSARLIDLSFGQRAQDINSIPIDETLTLQLMLLNINILASRLDFMKQTIGLTVAGFNNDRLILKKQMDR